LFLNFEQNLSIFAIFASQQFSEAWSAAGDRASALAAGRVILLPNAAANEFIAGWAQFGEQLICNRRLLLWDREDGR
jgi:hypothetical protein